MNYFIIIATIGLVVFIHELGHLVLAKFSGVPIEEFSIGFGPKLWKYKKGNTLYSISIIPIGGYVLPKINSEEEFFRIPVNKRIIFTLGGPLANIIFSLLLLVVLNIMSAGVTFGSIFIQPITQLFTYFHLILGGLVQLFIQPESLSGIVGIVHQGGEFIGGSPLKAIHFAMIISLNLAIFNLLPLPVLDGGKIILYCLEKINKKYSKLHLPLAIAGWVIILGLMLFVTINDIRKIFI